MLMKIESGFKAHLGAAVADSLAVGKGMRNWAVRKNEQFLHFDISDSAILRKPVHFCL